MAAAARIGWEGDVLAAGHDIEGRYLLSRPLASGAIGSVYEAESLAPALASHGARRVAVKVISRAAAADASALTWFIHEAFLGMRLRHRSLVRVVDYGRLPDERPYYAMQLAAGVTLDRLLDEQGWLSPALAVPLFADAAAGLEVLHDHGLVHRDVKPANLMVSVKRGRPPRLRVLDLGFVGVFDARRASRIGAVDLGARGTWGTPSYISPEQALGADVGPPADVYSLACTAYRVLTGRSAMRRPSVADIVHAHLFDEAPPASHVNPALPAAADEVFARALVKAPARRTPSPARFVAELGAALRVEA